MLPADLDAKALFQELPLVLQQLLNEGRHLLWGAVAILRARTTKCIAYCCLCELAHRMSRYGLLLPEVRGPHLIPPSTADAVLHSSWQGNGEASTVPQLRKELPPHFITAQKPSARCWQGSECRHLQARCLWAWSLMPACTATKDMQGPLLPQPRCCSAVTLCPTCHVPAACCCWTAQKASPATGAGG